MHDEAVIAHSTDEMNVRMAWMILCFCSLVINYEF